jgi:hypothetical protein
LAFFRQWSNNSLSIFFFFYLVLHPERTQQWTR